MALCVAGAVGQTSETTSEPKLPFRAGVEVWAGVFGTAGGGLNLRFDQGFDVCLGGYANWDRSGFGGYGGGAYRLPVRLPVMVFPFVRAGYHVQTVDTLVNDRTTETALDMFSIDAGVGAQKEFGARFTQALALKVGGRYSRTDYQVGAATTIGDDGVTAGTATYSRFPLLVEVAYTFYLPRW
jgi:hypothetical protein